MKLIKNEIFVNDEIEKLITKLILILSIGPKAVKSVLFIQLLKPVFGCNSTQFIVRFLWLFLTCNTS